MDIIDRLETTTAALLALRHAEHLPDASRGRWLRTVPRILIQFGLDDEAPRWPAPRADQVAVMTPMLAELDRLRDRDDDAFQAVFMRALTHPVTRRPLMAWDDVARALGLALADAHAAHRRGVAMLGDSKGVCVMHIPSAGGMPQAAKAKAAA